MQFMTARSQSMEAGRNPRPPSSRRCSRNVLSRSISAGKALSLSRVDDRRRIPSPDFFNALPADESDCDPPRGTRHATFGPAPIISHPSDCSIVQRSYATALADAHLCGAVWADNSLEPHQANFVGMQQFAPGWRAGMRSKSRRMHGRARALGQCGPHQLRADQQSCRY